MSEKHVAVAMSGGVDSAVAAYLAQQQGYEVTGINLQLDDSPADDTLERCCDALGIRLVRRDCRKNFHEKVIVPAAELYASGRTPNPCCECNRVLKFAELLAAADELGIRKVLTGHYVSVVQDEDGRFILCCGHDRRKDQSYFLCRLTQSELARAGFPLGGLEKSEVRRIADAAGLPCASRPDSQDVCFLKPGECCGETLRLRSGLPVRYGKFICNGKTVGRHQGIHRYTIGQRQGLNVALGVPGYISRIDPASGDIILTTDSAELMSTAFTVVRQNWISGMMPENISNLSVRVRYRSPGVECRMEILDETRLLVIPAVPQRAVTPGQAAVFYAGDIMLGGGEIESVRNDV